MLDNVEKKSMNIYFYRRSLYQDIGNKLTPEMQILGLVYCNSSRVHSRRCVRIVQRTFSSAWLFLAD